MLIRSWTQKVPRKSSRQAFAESAGNHISPPARLPYAGLHDMTARIFIDSPSSGRIALRTGKGPNKSCAMERGVAKSRLFAALASIRGAMLTTPAWAQAGYVDPAGSGPIVGAINWIQGTLLGTVATVVAVIAVAVVGLMMLTGRMNWRYGATVILGCFILFGAASIVAGIQSAAGGY
jgi:type IV secretion system protein VirB2